MSDSALHSPTTAAAHCTGFHIDRCTTRHVRRRCTGPGIDHCTRRDGRWRWRWRWRLEKSADMKGCLLVLAGNSFVVVGVVIVGVGCYEFSRRFSCPCWQWRRHHPFEFRF